MVSFNYPAFFPGHGWNPEDNLFLLTPGTNESGGQGLRSTEGWEGRLRAVESSNRFFFGCAHRLVASRKGGCS